MNQPEDVVIRRISADEGNSKKGTSAKKNTKKKKAESKPPDRSAFVEQYEKHIRIFSVVLALFSLLVLLALISYSPKDEINTDVTLRELLGIFKGNEEIMAKADTTSNWLSIIGAIMADRLINHTIGYAVLSLPFLLILWSISLFRRVALNPVLIRRTLVTFIFCLLFSSIMGTLSRIEWLPDISKEWSGSSGQFAASIISGFIGTAGSLLLLLTCFTLTLILGTNINFKELYQKSLTAVNSINSKISGILNRDKDDTETDEDISDEPITEEHVDTEEPARIFKSNINIITPNPARPSETGFVPSFRNEQIEKPVPIINSYMNSDFAAPKTNPAINELLDEKNFQTISGSDNLIEDAQEQSDTPNFSSLLPEIEDKLTEEYENIPESNSSDSAQIADFPPPVETVPQAMTPAQQQIKKPLTVTVYDNKKEEPPPSNPLSSFIHDEEIDYKPPTIHLLEEADEEHNQINEDELKSNARILQEKLETFKIYIENLSVTPGPVVTQYEFVPAAGIKISKIESLSDDIAMALKAPGIRIIAPIPGKGTVGIEIPNRNPAMVRFSSIIKSSKFHSSTFRLPLALGKTISGEVFCTDLSRMPHLLMAGSTGSGKSVGINTVITSLLYKMHPKNLKFVIIDPKKVELKQYEMLENHFLAVSPDLDNAIITDPADAVIALKSVCAEMDLRYDILAAVGQRNIFDYNKKVREGKFKDDKEYDHRPMPFIVVIIDELADLMLTCSKEVETPIIRLAQLARAVGIHLVVATQRPSVDVVTGIIKANFPARIAYLMASRVDSRTIIDVSGAEHLLGNGDMLFMAGGSPHPIRVQNSFLSTEEVENICEFIGKQKGYSKPYMLPSINEGGDNIKNISPDDRDPLFEEAARLIIRHQQGSVSLIQRRLKVGYARAGRIVDELEAAGVVGPFDGSKARIVLMDSESQLEAVL